MLKNNKMFGFLIILFSVLILLTLNVYASSDRFTFTGFDGNSYDFPALPEGVNKYNHYVLYKGNNGFEIFCFNEKLEVTRDDTSIYLNADDNTTGKLFSIVSSSSMEWTEQGE